MSSYLSWSTDKLLEYLKSKPVTVQLSQEDVEKLNKAENITPEDVIFHDKFESLGLDPGLKEKLRSTVTELRKEYNESQAKVFQDSIHGPMKFHPLIVKIIDTPQFQRLRNIKQLGGVYYVYPTASHNRFEHSLGVCHIAGKLIEELQCRQPELGIDERDILSIKIAALCHDMGHGPFSHLFQDLFIRNGCHKVGWKHEDTSVKLLDHLIQENDFKKEFDHNGLVWDESVQHNDKDFVKELIYGVSLDQLINSKETFKGRPKKKSFLYQIVANQLNGIDVDKMDYVIRDGRRLGTSNYNFNWSRYIEFIRVIDVDDEIIIKNIDGSDTPVRISQPCICPRDKMVPDLQELLHTRHALHYNAYQHKTKRAIECMLVAALEKVKGIKLLPGKDGQMKTIVEALDDMTAFTHLTDGIFSTIMLSESDDMKEAKRLLQRVEERDIYLCAHKERVSTLNMADTESASQQIADATQNLSTPLTKDQIKIIGVVYDYGMGNRNPFERVWCYEKSSYNKAFKCKVSKMYPLPEKFEESDYVVYCSRRVGEDVLCAIKSEFICLIPRGSN